MTVHFLNILNLTGLRSVFITLAHSLWLGAVMALLAGIIIILTNSSGSLLRYKLLTGLLILFAICITCVFYKAITSNIERSSAGNAVAVSGNAEILESQNAQQQKDLFTTLFSFIETHADTIVSMWFIVICFKCIRLVAGLRALHRMKKTNILQADTWWIERMNELAAKIGIGKQVTLLQSSLAKVPMVIGHLKPIILFPMGIINALPADEVEAILLHELAHIKRNDFLINLLQQFIEIFFFFNPAVLWVSSLIKNERENCCDDIAIAVMHDKRKFINALVAFQEYNVGLTYATTFPGSKNHLLSRVKRIITNNNKTLNNMEKLILASGIIITSLAALAFSPDRSKLKKETVKTAHTTAKATRVDKATTNEIAVKNNGDDASLKTNYSVKALLQKIISEDTSKIRYKGVIDGKEIQFTEEDGQVKELYVDGKKIPENQYDNYAIIIGKIHQGMKENTAKLKMQSELLDQEKEEMEKQQAEVMKEITEMVMNQDSSKDQELIGQDQDEVQKELLELMREKDETMMSAEALKDQAGYIKQKQAEMQNEKKLTGKENEKIAKTLQDRADLMNRQQLKMQKEMKRMNEKNQAMMKVQSQKMQTDLKMQQKILQAKQQEFQKNVEKMRLQQEKFNEIMKDSMRQKRITRVGPAVYSRPEVSAKPVVVVKSQISAKPQVSVRSATSAMPAVKAVPSAGAISVGVAPVAAITSVVAVNPPAFVTSNSISNEIINDLEKANIISTRNNLSFRITNDELIVNGVKQSDAIHQSILKKYVKKPGDNISLTYSNHQ